MFLHFINHAHATHYNWLTVFKSKTKKVNAEEVFKLWIRIFFHPKKVLVDNGGK